MSFVSYSLQEEEGCEGTNFEVIIAYTAHSLAKERPWVGVPYKSAKEGGGHSFE